MKNLLSPKKGSNYIVIFLFGNGVGTHNRQWCFDY